MSKTKKLNRLNAQIKRLFDGAGFDEGIVRLNSDELLGLAMHAKLDFDSAHDSSIIKGLRRAWSLGDVDIRKTITNYLVSLNRTFEATHQETPQQKEQKLAEILNTLSLDEATYKSTFEHFIHLPNKKINPSKITRFIARQAIVAKKEQIQKACEGTFDAQGVFEFFHAFTLNINDQTFSKIFVLKSAVLATHDFENQSVDALIQTLQEDKTVQIKAFQKHIDELVEALNNDTHPYLSQSERIHWLKTLSPDSTSDAVTFDTAILKRVIKEHVNVNNIIVTGDSISIIQKSSYNLSDTQTILYTYEAIYPIWKLSSLILYGKSLPIADELDAINRALLQQFESNYALLKEEILKEATTLNMPQDEALNFIHAQLKEHFLAAKTLNLSHKLHQKIVTNFVQFTAQLRYQKQREALLARTIKDFKALFEVARSQRRRIIFHAGPTNSGKTYDAMQALMQADTGVYLAPLRLLALEGYETLTQNAIPTTLLTGEEEIFNEDAGHVSSTIEMANFDIPIDVAVIDEIQMIADRDRGWAWANALIGIPAKTLYLTGSLDAIPAIKQLCAWLDEPLQIVEFARKNRQELLSEATPLKAVQKGTALVAFSRGDVLNLRQKLSKEYTISVIYGNLSPEVRREEAKRFKEGKSDILIATDAIAMGLNLPIKTLLFTKDSKFDGENRRVLSASEVQQIAGRAGRYGIEEVGFIGAIDKKILHTISTLLTQELDPIKPPFNVMANFEHIKLVASILHTQNLEKILDFFAQHMEFEGPFKAANFESMHIVAQIVDRFELSLKDKFTFATAPVSNTISIMEAFENYIKSFLSTKRVYFSPLTNLPTHAQTQEQLKEVEDKIKEISLYLWLTYRYSEHFIDKQTALDNRKLLNDFIENSLQKGIFIKRCRVCGKALPMDYEYAICQGCFMALNRQKRNQAPQSHTTKRK